MGLTWGEIRSRLTVIPYSAEVYICDLESSILRRARCVAVSLLDNNQEVIAIFASCSNPHPDLLWGEFMKAGKERPGDEEPHITLDGRVSFGICGVKTDSPLPITRKILLSSAPFPEGPEVSAERPIAGGPEANPNLN